MSTLDEMVGQYAKPIDVSGLAGDFNAGAQVGVQLAARRAQIAQFQQEMQYKNNALQQAKTEHMAGLFEAALKEDSPQVRDLRLKNMQQVGQQLNLPVSDDYIKAFSKSDDLRNQALNFLGSTNLASPDPQAQATRTQGIQLLINSGMAPVKAIDFINKWSEDQAKIEQSKALGQGKAYVAAVAGGEKRASDIVKFAASPQDAQIITGGPGSPGYLEAYGRAQANQKNQMDAQVQSKLSNTQSEIDYRKGRLDQYSNMNQYRQDRLAISKSMLDLNKQKFGLATQKAKASQVDKIQNDSGLKDYQTQIFGSQKALGLLDTPNMTWANFHETIADTAQLVKAKPGVVVNAYTQKQLSPKMAIEDMDRLKTWFSTRQEGGPTDELRGQMRDTITRLADVMSTAHDDKLNQILNARQKTGLFNPEEAGSQYDVWKVGSSNYRQVAAPGNATGSMNRKGNATPTIIPKGSNDPMLNLTPAEQGQVMKIKGMGEGPARAAALTSLKNKPEMAGVIKKRFKAAFGKDLDGGQ